MSERYSADVVGAYAEELALGLDLATGLVAQHETERARTRVAT
jgi:hypothetical protein